MKHEWRKHEKHLYLPKAKPECISVPVMNFACISGEGNPNSAEFASCIEALYTVSYGIKMGIKKRDAKPEGYRDWTVYPLEGVWDLKAKARQSYDGSFDKDDLVFDLMIRQPDFIDEELFQRFLVEVKKRKPNPILNRVKYIRNTEGRCIQMLHIGSYDDEPASFAQMEEFAVNEGFQRKSKVHREIYLSDFRKVPSEKLRTALRFQLNN